MAADLRIARPEAAACKLVTASSVPIREFAGSCGTLDANLEIKGTLQNFDSSTAFEFEVPKPTLGHLIGT